MVPGSCAETLSLNSDFASFQKQPVTNVDISQLSRPDDSLTLDFHKL